MLAGSGITGSLNLNPELLCGWTGLKLFWIHILPIKESHSSQESQKSNIMLENICFFFQNKSSVLRIQSIVLLKAIMRVEDIMFKFFLDFPQKRHLNYGYSLSNNYYFLKKTKTRK